MTLDNYYRINLEREELISFMEILNYARLSNSISVEQRILVEELINDIKKSL